jgi:hypothetical protein
MSDLKIKTALKDELPQTFTTQDVEDIKSAIDVPRANVYVKPYHIYDEDEHIVGEWRQTIDGVKKKKPVYERTVTGLSIKLNWNAQYATFASTNILIPSVDKILSAIAILADGESPIVVRQTSNTWELCGIDDNTIKGLVIRYTKTSDSWQEVIE